ncbi:hypothetical protein HDU67_001292 [Dinochytrium kinnereticum]|nr:hypothetical protein HDU67_001292 [Dinochytrium kinnereticum]
MPQPPHNNNNDDGTMKELIIVGAGPHCVSLMTSLMSPHTIDRDQEHPANGSVFHRQKVDTGDLTRTSMHIVAKRYHRDFPMQRKSDRELIEKSLHAADGNSSPGWRLPKVKGSVGDRYAGSGKDGTLGISQMKGGATLFASDTLGLSDDRARNAHGLGLHPFNVKQCHIPPWQWFLENVTILERLEVKAGNDLKGQEQDREGVVIGSEQTKGMNDDAASRWMPMWRNMFTMMTRATSETDLVPLRVDKDPIYSGPFLLPSTELFWKFTRSVTIEGFALSHKSAPNLVQNGTVVRIVPITISTVVDSAGDSKTCTHFEVHLADGRVMQAKNVVLAVGASNMARSIPAFAQHLLSASEGFSTAISTKMKEEGEGSPTEPFQINRNCSTTHMEDEGRHPFYAIAHCYDVGMESDRYIGAIASAYKNNASLALRNVRVVIIGGGLTSIHLTATALAYGCSNVTLCCRKKLRVQPFDVDTVWLSPRRPELISEFWSQNDRETRARILRQSKRSDRAPRDSSDGGCEDVPAASITLNGLSLIETGIAEGRVTIREQIEIVDAVWEASNGDNNFCQCSTVAKRHTIEVPNTDRCWVTCFKARPQLVHPVP